MKKILIVWTIIALILVGGLTFLGIKINSKNKEYYKLEDKLSEAAKEYYAQYPEELPASKTIITAERLVTVNFLNEPEYKDKSCYGYVIVKKNYIKHDFSPYIKCSKYQTKHYDPQNEGRSL